MKTYLFRFVLLMTGALGHYALADSITFNPSEGNALTPFTVSVNGFIGSNGPVGVTVYGGGLSGGCGIARPCTFAGNIGYFPGKHWVSEFTSDADRLRTRWWSYGKNIVG